MYVCVCVCMCVCVYVCVYVRICMCICINTSHTHATLMHLNTRSIIHSFLFLPDDGVHHALLVQAVAYFWSVQVSHAKLYPGTLDMLTLLKQQVSKVVQHAHTHTHTHTQALMRAFYVHTHTHAYTYNHNHNYNPISLTIVCAISCFVLLIVFAHSYLNYYSMVFVAYIYMYGICILSCAIHTSIQ